MNDSASRRHILTPLAEHPLGRARVNVIVTALMLSLMLQALDQTMVGTAMPNIVASLQGFDRYVWTMTAYLLGSTVLLPIAGRLSDQFGRKQFVLGGVALFVVGAALAGQAETMGELIVWRAVQGVAAGMGITLIFAVIADLFEPRDRARWNGFFGAIYGFASFAGPTLGGWLADHGPLIAGFVADDSRWRWVFYIHLPFGLISLALLAWFLPHDTSERVTRERGWSAVGRIDFGGAALAAVATVLLMLALTWVASDAQGWGSPRGLASLAGAALFFIAFFLFERRTAAEPILPLALLRIGDFRSAALLQLLIGMVMMSLAVFLPLYLQGVAGWSATVAGIAMLPLTLTATTAGTVVSYLLTRVGGRWRVICTFGAASMLLGVAPMPFMSTTTPEWAVALLMFAAGCGFGVYMPIVLSLGQIAAPRSMMGVATNVMGYLRSAGMMLGVAIVGAIVTSNMGAGGAPLAALRQGARVDGLETALQHGFVAIAVFVVAVFAATRHARDISIYGEQTR
jgi:EmrB/QacA subfamily drug resistance transporter